MALNGDIKTSEVGSGIQVAVRVRPLNNRERDEGFRSCVTFDEPSRQVVLQAVDKETLMQLRGCTAKGFAFDRRFGADQSSDDIYDSCVAGLVENLFKGYNATVLAYGQTGSGKTHTMSGGVGIHGMEEQGITRRAARHIFQIVDRVKQRLKPGEAIGVSAYALELYNEDLRDLSIKGANGQESARDRAERRAAAIVSGSTPRDIAAAAGGSGGGGVGSGASTPRERAGTPEPGEVRIAERPVGRDGRVVPEVLGVQQVQVEDAQALTEFFQECCENRSVASTRMNDRSSRSHAIYTVVLHRIMVDVSEDGGKVRTTSFESKFHLVDLAGSERVKRSGVTGQAFKEATHINSGLLALGNVIVALSGDAPAGSGSETPTAAGPGVAGAAFSAAAAAAVGGGGRRTHIPYRDSKLTRLLQDSLGGNSLTVLISCISSCEADFEETANTLKYANRACRIKNTPLPAKYSTLEEDLLPMLPEGSSGVHGMVQIQSLLEDHARLKELREKREADRRDRDEKRLTELRAMREAESKKPGYQRLRIMQYDELRRKLTSSQGLTVSREAVIADDTLAGFRKREEDESDGSSVGSSGPSFSRPTTASRAAGGGGSGRASPSPRDGRRPTRPMTAAARLGGGSSSDGAISPRGAPRAPRGSPAPAAAAAAPAATPATAGPATVIEGIECMEPRTAMGERQSGVAGVAVDALGAKLEGAKLSCIDEGMQTSPASDAAVDLIRAWRASDGEQPDAVGREVAGAEAVTAVVAAPAAAIMVDEAVGVMEDAASEAAAVAAAADAADAAALSEAEAVAAGKGVFSPFVQLEFKPRPEGDAPAVDTAATTAVETVPAPVIPAVAPPKLLARFRVNKVDSMAVFMATTAEDFRDVVGLLPANSALPASDKMSYLLGRLEVNCAGPGGLMRALHRIAAGEATMGEAVGPAVGCLMATMGTSLITDCIFDFEDPEELEGAGQEQRLELWGLQIPHSLSVRPPLTPLADGPEPSALKTSDSTWSTASAWTPGQLQTQSALQTGGHDLRWGSADRLNVSVGLLYALCAAAQDAGAIAGFCVPRPQLLKRWLQAGVKMRQVQGPARLIYPQTAHDYAYYKGSTVAYFLVPEVKASLEQVLSVVHEAA